MTPDDDLRGRLRQVFSDEDAAHAVEVVRAAGWGPVAGGSGSDSLIVRWQHLDEDQQQQVIEFLAERRTVVFGEALDFEERTRP